MLYPSRMTTVQPGPVATKFGENAKFGELDATISGLDEPSVNLIKKYQATMSVGFKDAMQQSDDIAKIILEAITSSNPHARYMTNPHFRGFLEKRYPDLTGDNFLKLLGDFAFGAQKQ